MSPFGNLDSVWDVVKDYVETMGGPEEEKCSFDVWGESKLEEISSTQRAVPKHQKSENIPKQIFGTCFVVDDFADQPSIMNSCARGNALNTFLVRGRHMVIPTFVPT